jgi:uncharacterized protein (DUF1330 family)
MTVTVLALLTVNDDEPRALARYFEITAPLLDAAGARITHRFTVNEAVVGHRPARMALLVEYPDAKAMAAVFDSPEYRAIGPVRDAAFLSYSISVVSPDTLPPAAAKAE